MSNIRSLSQKGSEMQFSAKGLLSHLVQKQILQNSITSKQTFKSLQKHNVYRYTLFLQSVNNLIPTDIPKPWPSGNKPWGKPILPSALFLIHHSWKAQQDSRLTGPLSGSWGRVWVVQAELPVPGTHTLPSAHLPRTVRGRDVGQGRWW